MPEVGEIFREEFEVVLVLGSIYSRNFHFEALGQTPGEAFLALEAGWAAHVEQTGADPDWFAENADDVTFVRMKVGKAYRDGEELQ